MPFEDSFFIHLFSIIVLTLIIDFNNFDFLFFLILFASFFN